MGAGAAEMSAAVMNRPHAIGMRETALRLATDKGVIGPAAFPQLVAHLEELIGDIIAVIVPDHRVQAEVPRSAWKIRGHDIPGDAPTGEMVERAEAAGMGADSDPRRLSKILKGRIPACYKSEG